MATKKMNVHNAAHEELEFLNSLAQFWNETLSVNQEVNSLRLHSSVDYDTIIETYWKMKKIANDFLNEIPTHASPVMRTKSEELTRLIIEYISLMAHRFSRLRAKALGIGRYTFIADHKCAREINRILKEIDKRTPWLNDYKTELLNTLESKETGDE